MTQPDNKTQQMFKSHIREEAAEAVVRTMNGQADVNFDKFKQNPAFQEELEANFETWSLLEALENDPELTQMAEASTAGSGSQKTFKRYGYAIAAVLPLFAMFIAFFGFDPLSAKQQEYVTEIQEQKTINIDGSSITLNTHSKILVRFTNNERTVQLVYGEALFHVSKDPSRPFHVINGNNKVTVIGTTFNVKVDEANMTVAVVEGKVSVQEKSLDSDNSSSVLLDAGKVSSSDGNANTTIAVKEVDDINAHVNWQKGTLQFKKATLSEVVHEAQRYTKKRLKLSPEIAELEITTILRIKSLEEDFAAMMHVIPIKVETDQQSIVIVPANK